MSCQKLKIRLDVSCHSAEMSTKLLDKVRENRYGGQQKVYFFRKIPKKCVNKNRHFSDIL